LLKIVSDSELMVRQMKGMYKVRHPELRKLYDEAQKLTSQIEHVEIRHALRENNQTADRLANEAMDRGKNSPRGETEPHVRSEFPVKSSLGIPAATSVAPAQPLARGTAAAHQEFEGIVRDGVIELLNGTLPEGTKVQVRARR
jgi:probable phosphoglycerate mutase